MKVESESEVAQSCLTLSDPMDCSLPGSSIHGIFQARVLETEIPRKPQKKTWYMYTTEYYLVIKKKLENKTKARCQVGSKAMNTKLTNMLRGKKESKEKRTDIQS